jgi:hypothetical protein
MDMFDILITMVLVVICIYSLYYLYRYNKSQESFFDMDEYNIYTNISKDVRYNFNNFNENKTKPGLVLTNKTGGFMIRVDYTKSDYTKEVAWIENDRSHNFYDMLIDDRDYIKDVDVSIYKAYYIKQRFNFQAYGTYKINIDSKDYESLIASVNNL